ncbi:hypothetical protein KBC04_00975 [Candidatus Babeliales bacterium]|nr:hypothetical protein [Candidatus Babeliales bacterium]MBP9843692.1 hypothetical protein [Candidatus Babeliales bacterium]
MAKRSVCVGLFLYMMMHAIAACDLSPENSNQQDSLGNTLLHRAALISDTVTIRILMNRPEVNPTLKNLDGKTAYSLAFTLFQQPPYEKIKADIANLLAKHLASYRIKHPIKIQETPINQTVIVKYEKLYKIFRNK